MVDDLYIFCSFFGVYAEIASFKEKKFYPSISFKGIADCLLMF